MEINKKLIIGIDLSFNSTGITITEFENTIGKSIGFYRLVFETKPTPIININQITYNLPTNISASDIVEDKSDFYSEDQANITIKAMICCKRIITIITKKLFSINKNPIDIYVNIEGFIMPSISGTQQFKSLSGLIMLQGMLRSELIKLKLTESCNIDIFKIFITSPTDLKLWFTGNGSADKQIMLDNFNSVYDGKILLPDTTSLAKVNDVIDSFALNMLCLAKLYGTIKYKPKKVNVRKKKKLPIDIIKNSIPVID